MHQKYVVVMDADWYSIYTVSHSGMSSVNCRTISEWEIQAK